MCTSHTHNFTFFFFFTFLANIQTPCYTIRWKRVAVLFWHTAGWLGPSLKCKICKTWSGMCEAAEKFQLHSASLVFVYVDIVHIFWSEEISNWPILFFLSQEVLVWLTALQKELGGEVSDEKMRDYIWNTLKSGRVNTQHLHSDGRHYLLQHFFSSCLNISSYCKDAKQKSKALEKRVRLGGVQAFKKYIYIYIYPLSLGCAWLRPCCPEKDRPPLHLPAWVRHEAPAQRPHVQVGCPALQDCAQCAPGAG